MIKGIDISHWQNKIDWTKIPAEFAIIKASQGTTIKDARFEEYKKGARDKGIGLGFYHFAAGIDPIQEANWFLKCVGDISEGEVLALDFEIHIANPIDFCDKFVQHIYNTVGFWPLFYSYSSLADLFSIGPVMNCGLWIADPSNPPRIGNWYNYAIWQYTTAGMYPGITTTVDLDYFKGDINQFKKYGKPLPNKATVISPLTAENITNNEPAQVEETIKVLTANTVTEPVAPPSAPPLTSPSTTNESYAAYPLKDYSSDTKSQWQQFVVDIVALIKHIFHE